LRDATTALCPVSKTSLANSHPNPVEQPVINHTLLIGDFCFSKKQFEGKMFVRVKTFWE
jgi:hypothetical protein